MQSMGTWWLWLIFGLVVLAMLAIDLFLFKGGQQHRVSLQTPPGSPSWLCPDRESSVHLYFSALQSRTRR